MRALSIFLAVALSACSSFGGGSSNVEPPSPLVKFKPSVKVKHVWSALVGTDAVNPTALLYSVAADDRIVVADPFGRLTALTANKGKRLWHTDLKRALTGGVGAGGGKVFVGSEKGVVISVNTIDGTKRWEAQLSGEILAPVAVAGDQVFAQSGDGKLFALALKDGSQQWQQERSEPSLTLRGTAAPLVIGNKVVAGFANGKLVAFRRDDGTPLWETTVAEPRGRDEIERLVDVDSTPLTQGNLVYTAAYQAKIVAVQADTGALAWSREISTYWPMALDGERLYIVDDRGVVYALDALTGATVWKQDRLRARGVTAATSFEKYVAVADRDGYVHFLQKDDGAFAARYHVTADAIQVRPLAYDRRLYVLDRGGNLNALVLK